MDFGLAEGGTDAEDGAFAIGADADGDEHGAVAQEATVADFFITGVEDEIGIGLQRTFAPELEFDIEFGGTGADPGGTDLMAAEFLNDFGDFAGGDALETYICFTVFTPQGQHQSFRRGWTHTDTTRLIIKIGSRVFGSGARGVRCKKPAAALGRCGLGS